MGSEMCIRDSAYNAQPDIKIDYKTGDSKLISDKSKNTGNNSSDQETKQNYIVNLNTKKFHKPNCRSVSSMSERNKKTYKGKRSSLINNGYSPCKICNP